MSWRRTALLVLLAVLAIGGAKLSGAYFSASSANADNRFEAALDFMPPSVSMADPGSPLKGPISLAASGSDATSGIASLTIQRRPSGGSIWTEVCTSSQSPLSCSFDTATAATPDGLYDVRAVATDGAGNTATQVITDRRIDNTAPTSVTMDDPGTSLTGTETFSGGASDSGSGIASLKFQYRPAGGSSWTDACTTSSTSCSFNTATISDGSYDLRALATDNAGNQTASAVHSARTVDNTAATSVTMDDPGTLLTGAKTFSGGASDSGSGIASLKFQYRPAGGSSWTDACTTSSTSCSFNTATISDGSYDLRALATDNAGNETASAVHSARKVDNTAPSVTLSDPGAMRATVTLLSTTGDGSGSGVSTVRYQYATVGGSTWTDACTATTAPFSCSFDTTTSATPDGRYDLRAIATDAAGFSTTSAIVTDKRIDNTAPTSVTMSDPGTLLTGAKTFSGGASDSGSGIASLKFQYRPAGGSSWTDACTTSSTSCSFNTATISDGSYDLRALATDNAGNQTASAVHSARTVDNTGPAVTLTSPGTHVGGTVSFDSTASDSGSGVASVKVQYRPLGGTSYTDLCSDATAPYSCNLNTRQGCTTTCITPDGPYEFRAVATDNAGLSTTSAIINVTIDNTRPTGADVQAYNGAATPGVIETGDKLELRFSETMKPSTILAGWDGSSTTVTVRFSHANGGDRIEFYDAANTTRLNLTNATKYVNLVGDYVPAAGADFAATMLRNGATISITLGTLKSGSVNSVAPLADTMSWSPSDASTDLAGNLCQATLTYELVLEGGSIDVEF